MDKITLTVFTDPMMGLTYECTPVFDQLKNHYGDRLEIKYIMAGLVRDVSDFMTPAERALEPAESVRTYCRRLAQIYKSEEPIGGLPINMEGFHLFDAEHRSSYPLDIAYKAAQLADPDKADLFLKNLQLATIVETRQTTLPEELLSIAVETGIDPAAFRRHFEDGSAEAAFQEDLQFTRSLGIYSLPTFLLQYREKAMLIGQLIRFEDFKKAIQKLTEK